MAEQTFTIRDQRTERRFFVDNMFVDDYGPIVGPYGHAVYNVLLRFSRPDGRGAWPSHATIAERAGCGIAKVKQVIKQFQDLGLVAVQHRYNEDNGAQTSNEYIILDPPAMERPPVTTDTPARYPTDTPGPVSQEATINPPIDQSSPKNPKPTPQAAEPQDDGEADDPLPGTEEPWSGPPPPAAHVFRSRTNRWPRRASYRRLHEAVGDGPDDLEFWGEVVAKYVDLGWNPLNVDGMVGWFLRGKLPEVSRANGGRESRQERNLRMLAESRQRRLEETGALDGQYTVL